MTAGFGAARWPVPGGQIPWKGVDQLAHVHLFWPRWTVQCTTCQSFHFLRRFLAIPYYPFLVPYYSG